MLKGVSSEETKYALLIATDYELNEKLIPNKKFWNHISLVSIHMFWLVLNVHQYAIEETVTEGYTNI